ncbi:MAG TPA: chemotaxis-specific protein-glutamate methyltransferase CheB [Gemmatimonadales bacterium]|nr:chemotaxis-specific protein-glutamate methyltransferase CheB [Gemmatimonadales bacterium]
MTRIFVVDDSAFIRKALARVLQAEPSLELVGEAASGEEAVAKIPEANPDLVTLDVEMPGMDGQQVLRALLRWKPTLKVVMLSAYTREGAEATIEALAAGAVDFIDKTSFNVMDFDTLRREVIEKLKILGLGDSKTVAPKGVGPVAGNGAAKLSAAARCELCVIGASTGGPMALHQILERIPAGFPMPIAIVQHMPAGFTGPFAERLSRLSRLQVSEAVEGDRLRSGRVLVAPAGRHLRITSRLTVALEPEPADAKHIPSVDVTMNSADRARPGRVLGILLTGMGQDGAEGMATIRASGGFTIGESEATCVVYGMPRAAEMRGAVECMLPLPEIVSFLEGLGSL